MVGVSIFNPFHLTLEDMTISYEEGFSLGPLTETFSSGEMVQVLGPNGAGKTSFLRALSGFVYVKSGRVNWDGLSLDQPCRLFLSESLGAFSSLTVVQHLSFWAALYETEPLDAKAVLDFFGLTSMRNQKLSRLSAGERQRVSLMRLVLSQVPVWLLDEPFTFIDKAFKKKLEQLFIEHCARGGLVFFSTHAPLDLPNLKSLQFSGGRNL